MSRNDMVVAEYDYYTLEQARRILYKEQRKKTLRKKKRCIEEIKLILTLSLFGVVFPAAMILYWVVIGY